MGPSRLPTYGLFISEHYKAKLWLVYRKMYHFRRFVLGGPFRPVCEKPRCIAHSLGLMRTVPLFSLLPGWLSRDLLRLERT